MMMKNARLNLGLSLDKVSEDLKIKKRYLQAIEDGSGDDILPHTYVKGYIRLYSKYLQILDDVAVIPDDIHTNNYFENEIGEAEIYKKKKAMILLFLLFITTTFLGTLLYRSSFSARNVKLTIYDTTTFNGRYTEIRNN